MRTVGRALALVVLLATAHTHAATIEGITFPDRLDARGTAFTLHNTALLRWKLVFKAYVAALYRERNATRFDLAADTPKRLVINYFYGFTPEQFSQATIDGVALNRSKEQQAALRPRIDRFNALYRAVQPNDQYALTYVPGQGTELALNGKSLGSVEGADFAAAMFDIWLGKNPISTTFRDQILAPRLYPAAR